jgi:hypothetical protein
MANFALIFFLIFFSAGSFAQVFDASAQSSIVSTPDGNFYIKKSNALLSSLSAQAPTRSLSIVESMNVPTSKGTFLIEVPRTMTVDTGRIGKVISAAGKIAPPIAFAAGTVSLICELTPICDQAGEWFIEQNDPLPGHPDLYPAVDGKYNSWPVGGVAQYVESPQAACNNAARISANVGPSPSQYIYSHHTLVSGSTTVYTCFAKGVTGSGSFNASSTTKSSGCATGYTILGSDCFKTGLTAGHVPTSADWDSIDSLLNDSRFLEGMLETGLKIPTGIPSFTNPFYAPLGTTTTTLKDGVGTTTGTEVKDTKLELNNPNPVDPSKPNNIQITETTTTTTYNNNNQVTNITTTVTTPAIPLPNSASDPTTIAFDTVNDTALGQKTVAAPFTITSWGAGECPPNIDFSLSSGEQSINSQPFCDFAISLKPVLLLIATLAGAYIVISSTRPTT